MAKGVLIALAAGAFLAISGAFGSGEASYPRRFAYWVALMLGGGLFGGFVAGEIERRGWLEEQPWRQGALIAALITPPLTVAVWAATGWWFVGRLEPSQLPAFVAPVATISALMTAVNFAASRRPPVTHAAVPGAPAPRFLERLPFKLRGAELHAVQAEDHYLRLHTDRGSDLILMRLSDAVAELEGLEGAQTHRSWWVAKPAVEDVRRGDGRAVLKLKGGLEAPVSRTYARALRDAGWF